MERAKYIIRQVPAEQANLSWYFEGDYFKGEGEYYCHTLFLIQRDYYHNTGLNSKEYDNLLCTISNLVSDFEYVKSGTYYNYDGKKETFKDIMKEYGMKYSPAKCHKLKMFVENYRDNVPETVAEYLTITTGKKWSVTSSRGYCQGDYVEIVFCEENYSKNEAETAGDIYLGAASEYCLITLDENGEETDSCYGYIVSDWQTNYSNIKETLCKLTDTNPEETIVQIVSGQHTRTEYEYEEV